MLFIIQIKNNYIIVQQKKYREPSLLVLFVLFSPNEHFPLYTIPLKCRSLRFYKIPALCEKELLISLIKTGTSIDS